MEDPHFWFDVAKWFESKAGMLNLVLLLWIVWAEARAFFGGRQLKTLTSKMMSLMLEDVAAKKDLGFAIDRVLVAADRRNPERHQ